MRLPQLIALGLASLGTAPAAARAQARPEPLVSAGVLAGSSLPAGRWSRLVHDPGYPVGGLAERAR